MAKEPTNYLKPQLHIVQGDATSSVPKLAKNFGAYLVAMEKLDRTGVLGLLIGNTDKSILSQLDCSVLAFKPEGS